MRRWVPALLLMTMIIAGCAAPAASTLRTGRNIDVTPETAAPPAPAAIPTADDLRVAPNLTLTTAGSTRAYTGRGTYFLLVEEVGVGVVLPYQESQEGWFWVKLPSGASGWVNAADIAMTDAGGSATYQVGGGKWSVSGASGWQVQVARQSTGLATVTVRGLAADPAVQEVAGGVALRLPAPATGLGPVALPVGDAGLQGVSVSPAGVLIETEGAPLYKVVDRSGGALTLEFRPGLVGVAALPAGGGWRLDLRGAARPALRQEGGQLVIDLPAAALAPGAPPAPGGVSVTTGAQGLSVALPGAAGPFALYRPAPGQVELRYLQPGIKGKTVVLDPGHGGEETGTGGVGTEIEKDLNLDIALRVKPLLEAAGARVVMTRSTDARVLDAERASRLSTVSERTRADLETRANIANAAGADLFLSIHCNGGAAADRGTETYWATPNLNAALSKTLAELVQSEVLQAFGLPDRGVRQRPFYVIRYTDAPAVLAELGFLTNAADHQVLSSAAGRQAAAEALARAVTRYFEVR